MPRYIDADTLYQKIDAWREQIAMKYGEYDEYVSCLGDVLDIIDDAMTEDVVEVARCKDCKFYSPNLYLPNNGGGCTRCGGMEYLITADEYCSKGERKEKTDAKIH